MRTAGIFLLTALAFAPAAVRAADLYPGAQIAADGETGRTEQRSGAQPASGNPRPTLDNLPALSDKRHGRW